MSRIGKKVIAIPEKTDVTMSGRVITVKGPKGSLEKTFNGDVEIKVADGAITLTPKRNSNDIQALWGTYASHLINMVEGVNKPFVKKLVLEGIGYKADVKGTTLALALGLSHPVNIPIPAGLTVTSDKGIVTITGINKEQVGQFAASIRALKKPEPYKGKGFRYDTEVIRRKQGKKSV